jgi:predicted transcriptional regulator of viral defense system
MSIASTGVAEERRGLRRAQSRRHEPLTVTIHDAADMSGLSQSAIKNLIRRGDLESRLLHGRRLIVVASLRERLALPVA